MFEQVKIVLAGMERLVPKSLLSAYKSFGWREVSGANPEVEKKTGETKPRQSSTRKKKEAVK